MVSILSIIVLGFISMVSIEGAAVGVNCNPENPGEIDLKEFVITPRDPVRVGDTALLNLAVELSEDLVQPIQTDVTLKRRLGPFYITVPCLDNVGSCTYPDWCNVCTTCDCPLKAGERKFGLPLNITSSSLIGTYQATIFFYSATGQTGCVEVTNIIIE